MADSSLLAEIKLPISSRSRPGSAERKNAGPALAKGGRQATSTRSGNVTVVEREARPKHFIFPTGDEDVSADVSSQHVSFDDSLSSVPSTKIRVVCRLQPLTEEERRGTVPAVTASTERQEVVAVKAQGDRQSRLSFRFDHVLSSFSTQIDVFAVTLKPLIRDVLSGYEAAVFAYGQTGTGKTYTMEGDLDSSERRGLVPRAAEALIRALAQGPYSDYSVFASCLEIYNEELIDLLAPQPSQQRLELKETGHGVCCVGLSETPVSSWGQIQDLIRRAQERRQVAETKLNARSSRSHCLFTLKVNCRQRVEGGEVDCSGKLHLVDLAGSECARNGEYANNEACAKQERERRNINQSLLTLGRVIAALRDESSRVPYRDSKLTRMLQQALGGGCRTVMIATISSRQSVIDETISTLQYAEQATGIQNKLVQVSSFHSGRTPVSRSTDSCAGDEGRADMHELQMRLEYLSQEVEEAHSAFEQKQREVSELRLQAEAAEAKCKDVSSQLEEATKAVSARDYAFARLTQFADERTAEVKQLKSALDDEQRRCAGLLLQMSERKAQVSRVCAEGEEQALRISSAAQIAQQEASDASDAARSMQLDGMRSITKVTTEQSNAAKHLINEIKVHGENVEQKFQEVITSLSSREPSDQHPSEQEGDEENGKRLSQAMQSAFQALQDILIANVEDCKKHSGAVSDMRSQAAADIAEALVRRNATREAVEQLVAAQTATSTDHIEPFRDVLQGFEREFSTRSGGLDAVLTSLTSQLTALRNELAKTTESGESSVKEAIAAADRHLTAMCSEADDQLSGLRKLLLNAAASLRVDNAAELVGKRLADANVTLAESVGQELVALAAARKAVSDDVEMLREKMAAEQKVINCLTQQREVLTEEVKKIQSSLASITKDASGAHSALTTVEEEQRRHREATLAAIVRGVQDLVRSELGALDKGLSSGIAPVHTKLDQIQTLATEADSSLTVAEHQAVDAGMQAATAVSTWAVEMGSVCNSIQSAQAKADHAGKEIQATTSTVASNISSICEQVRTWGVSCTAAHDTLDGAALSARNIEGMQESALHRWDTAREVALRSTQDWASTLAKADSTLEASLARHSDAAQEVMAVCKHVTKHNTLARESMLEFLSHEERRAVALDKLSAAQARHAEEECDAETSRCRSLESLLDSAGAISSATACQAHQFRDSWHSILEATQTMSLAASTAEQVSQEHQFAIDSMKEVASKVEEAQERSTAAAQKYATHVAGLAGLPAMWREGVAVAPLSAFTDDLPQDDEILEHQVSVAADKRPTYDDLLVEYHDGEADLEVKSGTQENDQRIAASKFSGVGKSRFAEKSSARGALKEVQRALAPVRC